MIVLLRTLFGLGNNINKKCIKNRHNTKKIKSKNHFQNNLKQLI